MKPKAFKIKKKRMDIDAFIENELSNLNSGGGEKPSGASKPFSKIKSKKPTMTKPSFASKKIKKREPRAQEAIELSEPAPETQPFKKINKAPVLPVKKINKPGSIGFTKPVDETPDKPKRPQGPSKLLELQNRAKNRPFDEPETHPEEDKNQSDYDDSFENYEEDDFESDDDKKDIKKALNHENRKAKKFQIKNKPAQNEHVSRFMTSNGFDNQSNGSRSGSKPRLKTPDGGFAQSRGIVVKQRKVNKETANKQNERIANLRSLVEIEIEEYDNQLNLKPQTGHDLYFNKLQTKKIQNQMVHTNDDNVSRDLQTDPIDEKSLAMQCPEDLFDNSDNTEVSTTRDLDGFIRRVTPVVEMVLEENIHLANLTNPKAKERNPVEEKAKISCPNDFLKVLKSKILYISCMHSFETAPHRKCAVSYVMEDNEGEKVYMTIVFHLSSSSAIKYLKTRNEVNSICTPFENVVICGTNLGSICVFDLDDNVVAEKPDLGDETGVDFEMEALKNHYKIIESVFSTDGLPDPVHCFEIKKILSLVKRGSCRIVCLDGIGMLSSWILIELPESDMAGSLADLTMRAGSKIKLALQSVVDLSSKLNIVYDPDTFEIDFDPNDHNSFVFSTTEGMYFSELYSQSDESTSIKGGSIRQLDTSSIGKFVKVTSLSFSDQGFVLIGFEDGSIGLYHINFTNPLSIWYNA